MANGFQKQVAQTQVVDSPNAKVVRSAGPDYTGAIQDIAVGANQFFEGRAVDDLLGSEELPTTSIEHDVHATGQAAEEVVDIDKISGLKGIAAARSQGLSPERAQVMATAKLYSALEKYPQHKQAILAAYDNVVDPLSGRGGKSRGAGGSIFEPTQQEAAARDAADAAIKRDEWARKQGPFLDYEDWFVDQTKKKKQIETKALEDQRLKTEENRRNAHKQTLENNIHKGIAIFNATMGEFSRMQMQEGGLNANSIAEMIASIDQFKLGTRMKIADFGDNKDFDRDAAYSLLEESTESLKATLQSQDAGDVAEQLLKTAESSADLEAWSRNANAMLIMNTGSGSGVQILEMLNRVTGDREGLKDIKSKFDMLLADSNLSQAFKKLVNKELSFAEIDNKDKETMQGIIQGALTIVQGEEEKAQMSEQMMATIMDDVSNIQQDPVSNIPDINEDIPVPSVANLLDPAHKASISTPDGLKVAQTVFSDNLDALRTQVMRDAEGATWEIQPNGKVKGSITRKSAGRRVNVHRFPVAEANINDVLMGIVKEHPAIIGESFEGAVLPIPVKSLLVDMLNEWSNPPIVEDVEEEESSQPSRSRRRGPRKATPIDSVSGNPTTDRQRAIDDSIQRIRIEDTDIPQREFPQPVVEPTGEDVFPEVTSGIPLPEEGRATELGDVQDISAIQDFKEASPVVIKAAEFIGSHEGLRLDAYQDSAGIWTIGYGSTKGVKKGDSITKEEATMKLASDMKEAESAVDSLVKVPLTEAQKAAVVSLVFNVGRGAFSRSKALTALNKGDVDTFLTEAFDENRGFVKAGGKALAGLIKRRDAERNLFLHG